MPQAQSALPPLAPETVELMIRAAAALKEQAAGEVYVFGSLARCRDSASSDIDLTVSGLLPRRFFLARGNTQDVLPRPLDLLDLDEDTPFTRFLRPNGELRRVG